MQLLFPLNKTEELDDAFYSKSYTVSVLSIGDVKRCCIALHFIRKEREVYPVGCDEERGIKDVADKRIKPFKLLVCKRRSWKYNKVFRLRP
jgi:hypothetical protein